MVEQIKVTEENLPKVLELLKELTLKNYHIEVTDFFVGAKKRF